MSLIVAGLACAGSYVLFRFTQMLIIGRRLKADVYVAFSAQSIFRVLVPSWVEIPWIISGNMHLYRVKHSEFSKIGRDAYIQLSIEQSHIPTVFVADPQAIKEITRPRAPFLQDDAFSELFFSTYGPNVVTVEGEAWKRHRKISQKAFSEQNLQLVWSESMYATEKLFEKWDEQREQDVHVPHVTSVAETLALMVGSSAVLGQRMSWDQNSNKVLPPGYTISFQEALTVVSRSIISRVLTPTWAENLTRSTRKIATSFNEFGRYLKDMAVIYKKQGKLDQDLTGTETITTVTTENLFSIIMKASDEDKAEHSNGLTDEEVTGNAFIFLLAGHETTAHALAFALGLLAAHPEIQQEVYAQVKEVLGQRKTLEHNDLNELKLVTGTFLEALRIYPVVPWFPKVVSEDSILSVSRNDSQTENNRENIFIPAKSWVIVSVLATHYNPLYWPEPEQFRPARFTGAYNKDAFLAFSVGRRACIGRRFAEIEATAVLATILARYEISVDDTKFPAILGESTLARRERLLWPKYLVTLAPEKLPLVFKRR